MKDCSRCYGGQMFEEPISEVKLRRGRRWTCIACGEVEESYEKEPRPEMLERGDRLRGRPRKGAAGREATQGRAG